MSSIDQTLKKAKEIDERYKKFLAGREESQKSMQETFKKIDRAQNTLQETKSTIGNIDQLYDRIQKVLSDSIDTAVSSFEKTNLTAAEPGFEPNRVDAKKVAQMLKDKKKIMVLTGAGISAASGIPTFRGDNGFWKQQKEQIDPQQPIQKIDPQIILTNAFYTKYPDKTWEWLRNFYSLKAKAKPNRGHFALAEVVQNLRAMGKQMCIVTQNIDNFHTETKLQRVSKNKNMKDYPIFEIHGNILKIRCTQCSMKEQTLKCEPFEAYVDILEMNSKIYCPKCQAILRPHIMFFDEIYEQTFNHSESVSKFFEGTQAILVIGTSLQTGLANSLIIKSLEKGVQIVQINPSCEIRKSAVWWMQEKAEKVLQALKEQVIKK